MPRTIRLLLPYLLLVIVHSGISWALLGSGLDWRIAQLGGGAASLIIAALGMKTSNAKMSIRWWWVCYSAFSALVFGAAVQALYLDAWPGSSALSLLGSAATFVLVLGLAHRSLPFCPVVPQSPGQLLQTLAPFAVLSLLGMRLVFSPLLNLITEEAYYWKYAEHLDFGYLDHPPAVAFLISLGQSAFGIGEFGVRIGATLCWLVMAYFLAKLTTEWFERRIGAAVLFILAVLPFSAGVGFTMTPDAPLVACWAAALYYLHRVFLRQEARAWYPMGIALGLGFLSKYPMVLLAAGIPVFMLVDAQSRHWFKRPQSYAAAIIAFLVFSPVLFWNASHGWASFTFQGARRFSAPAEFSLHLWIAFLLLLLTPVGVQMVWLFFIPRRWQKEHPLQALFEINRRLKLFAGIFCALPLCAFGYASLTQEVKVNWLGPALLSITPLLALTVLTHDRLTPAAERVLERIHRGWLITALVIMIAFQLTGYVVGVGVPGIPSPRAIRKFVGWEQLAQMVHGRESQLAQRTGAWPVVIGADTHYVPSELGFYRAKLAVRRGEFLPEPTQGRALLGAYSLMYQFWSEPERYLGRNAILISRTESDLSDSKLGAYFEEIDPVESLHLAKDGLEIGTFYLRVGYHYRKAP